MEILKNDIRHAVHATDPISTTGMAARTSAIRGRGKELKNLVLP
jgi:hypothetical protein